MTIENKKSLGWGLIGTPNGRQFISSGVDTQLNRATSFDLNQNYVRCLSLSDNDYALYRLMYSQPNENTSVIGISEYRFVYENTSDRRNGYFGSFIETVNSCFSEKSLDTLFSALWDMSYFQYQHFIDSETKCYNQSIEGKDFQSPEDKLNHLATNLQPPPANYLAHIKQSGDLYIQCEKGQAVAVLKTLLNSNIFCQYKYVFFSENEHISAQMRSQRIEFKTASQLLVEPFFTQPYQQEIATLHQHIKQVQSHRQQAEQNFNQLRANQESLVKTQVEQKVQTYIAEKDRYKAEAEQAQRQAQASGVLAELGKQVLDYAAQNADKLDKVELAQFAPRDNDNNEINIRIARLTMSVEQLNRKLTEAMQSAEEPERSSNVITWILGAISAVLFAILMGILIMGAVSDDKTIPKKEYDSLKKEEAKAKDLEKKLKDAQDKLQTQKFSQEDMNKKVEQSLHDFKQKFCPKFKKEEKSECENYQK